MFGVSFPEIIIVFLIALLVFGPEKLPELARTLGKLSAQLRRQSDSVRKEFYNSVYKPSEDIRQAIRQEARSLVSEPIAKASEETPLSVEDEIVPTCSETAKANAAKQESET